MRTCIYSQAKCFLVFVAGVLLTSCQSAGKLAIAPQSTKDNLVFVLSAWSDPTPGNLKAVYVSRCIERGREFPEFGERIWAASVAPGLDLPMVGRFTYGKNLAGLITSREPESLGSGCYIAQAYANFPDPRAAVIVFRISPEGGISDAHAQLVGQNRSLWSLDAARARRLLPWALCFTLTGATHEARNV